jgi:hypothetical protein
MEDNRWMATHTKTPASHFPSISPDGIPVKISLKPSDSVSLVNHTYVYSLSREALLVILAYRQDSTRLTRSPVMRSALRRGCLVFNRNDLKLTGSPGIYIIQRRWSISCVTVQNVSARSIAGCTASPYILPRYHRPRYQVYSSHRSASTP